MKCWLYEDSIFDQSKWLYMWLFVCLVRRINWLYCTSELLTSTPGAVVRTMTMWPTTIDHNHWPANEQFLCYAAFSASSPTNTERSDNEMSQGMLKWGGSDMQANSRWLWVDTEVTLVWLFSDKKIWSLPPHHVASLQWALTVYACPWGNKPIFPCWMCVQ